ncbi:MAG TPA: VOC family protein [Caulobacteraceae bacterium]
MTSATAPAPILGAISSVRVWVADLARSRTFFAQVLGLEETSFGPIATFKAGPVTLVVEQPEPGQGDDHQALIGRSIGVCFSAADAQGAYDALRARGVVFLEPPEKQPWGGILAHLSDPDGNIFTVVQMPA